MKLWYQTPARRWDQALPLGNGRLGAMVFGGIEKEHIQLNEDTLWGGSYVDRHNPDALAALPKIRSYILNDQIAEAERLAKYALTATPQSERPYQSLGDIEITFYGKHIANPNETFMPMFGATIDPDKQPDQYERSLSLSEGIARTIFSKGEDRHEREVFISYPDDVLVIHLKSKGSETLHFDCAFDRRRNLDHAWKIDDHTIAYDGNTGENAIRFTGMMKAVVPQGKVYTIGEHLIVEDAPEATLLFTAASALEDICGYDSESFFRISNEGTEDVNLRITVPEQGDDETKDRAQVIMRTCELGLIAIARDYNDSKNRYVEIIHSRTPEV